jgi:hypothetical protein
MIARNLLWRRPVKPPFLALIHLQILGSWLGGPLLAEAIGNKGLAIVAHFGYSRNMNQSNDPTLVPPSVESNDVEMPDDLDIETQPGCLRCGRDLSKLEQKEGRKFCSECVE